MSPISSFFGVERPGRPSMKVCMMGPRAVGKTTILTAVFNETAQQITGTKLKLTARGDTGPVLLDRQRELKSVFKKHADVTTVGSKPGAGIAASSTEGEFQFSFGLLGKDPSIDLDIKDFPGEYVESDPGRVTQFINESTAVFLAVDTPHLMERGGEFNEVKNKTSLITRFFEHAVHEIDTEKLVIIIPLKCEKYAHEGRMAEVLGKVETTYAKLIDTLRKSPKVCCTIAPIITLGGVEFKSFDLDDGGQVRLYVDGCPTNVHYDYTAEGEYKPLFCSQPLYAMLSFVAAQYTRNTRNESVWDKIKKRLFNLFKSDKELFDEVLKMEKNRLADNPTLGYKVVCGGELFHYNH